MLPNLMKIATLVLCFSFATGMQGQETYRVDDFQMSVSGTSSLHDWTSSVTDLSGQAEITMKNGILTDIPSLNLKIRVEGIESTKGRIMDNKTYKALESDDHPYITFRLSKLAVKNQADKQITVTATGNLTIAGKTRSVSLDAQGTKQGNAIHFKGSKDLKMTDFGIDPPTAMLGALKTGDDITIDYSLALKTDNSAGSR